MGKWRPFLTVSFSLVMMQSLRWKFASRALNAPEMIHRSVWKLDESLVMVSGLTYEFAWDFSRRISVVKEPADHIYREVVGMAFQVHRTPIETLQRLDHHFNGITSVRAVEVWERTVAIILIDQGDDMTSGWVVRADDVNERVSWLDTGAFPLSNVQTPDTVLDWTRLFEKFALILLRGAQIFIWSVLECPVWSSLVTYHEQGVR